MEPHGCETDVELPRLQTIFKIAQSSNWTKFPNICFTMEFQAVLK